MEDFPFEEVFFSLLIMSGYIKIWFKYRDEMKLRHEAERKAQELEQELFLLKEMMQNGR